MAKLKPYDPAEEELAAFVGIIVKNWESFILSTLKKVNSLLNISIWMI